MKNREFANGFDSWQETHFEVVSAIKENMSQDDEDAISNVLLTVQRERGHGGLYELAVEWTDEFEKKTEGKEWDGDFFDAIEDFLEEKMNQ